jgi:hypothetical protein
VTVGEPAKPLLTCSIKPGESDLCTTKDIKVIVPAGKSVVIPLAVSAQADVH